MERKETYLLEEAEAKRERMKTERLPKILFLVCFSPSLSRVHCVLIYKPSLTQLIG